MTAPPLPGPQPVLPQDALATTGHGVSIMPLPNTSWNTHWGDAHWGFVLAGYGLTLLTLAWLLAGSLLRLHRARKRLALLESLKKDTAHTAPNPPKGQEKD